MRSMTALMTGIAIYLLMVMAGQTLTGEVHHMDRHELTAMAHQNQEPWQK